MPDPRDFLLLNLPGQSAGIGDLLSFHGFEAFPSPVFWLLAGNLVTATTCHWLLMPCDNNAYPSPDDDEIEAELRAGTSSLPGAANSPLLRFTLRGSRAILLTATQLATLQPTIAGHLGPEGLLDLAEVLAMAARGWQAPPDAEQESAARQRLRANHLASLDAAIASALPAAVKVTQADFAAAALRTRTARLQLVEAPRPALAADGGESLAPAPVQSVDLGAGRSAEFYRAPRSRAIVLRLHGVAPELVLCGGAEAVKLSEGIYRGPEGGGHGPSAIWRWAIGGEIWNVSVNDP